MERLTQTSDKGGVAFTFDLDVTCYKSEMQKILRVAEKLKAYEDAEEQGLLLRLPCKVGDTAWVKMQSGSFAEAEVRDYVHFLTCGFCLTLTSKSFDKQHIPFSEIGKSVFLTRQEAEQALAERKGE